MSSKPAKTATPVLVTRFGERDLRLSPHFRALSIGGARKGFRLEAVYWEALNAIAARNGRSLTEEVAATLKRLGSGGNDAAALRASVTADLYDLWKVAAARQARLDWTKVIDELPGLVFAVTPSQNLIAINARLRDRLKILGGEMDGAAALQELRVGIDPSVVTQVERRRTFLDCSVSFERAGWKSVRRARLGMGSETLAGSTILLGFVEA
jgi:predicted DNA-binding ribbon-helix-helix protein